LLTPIEDLARLRKRSPRARRSSPVGASTFGAWRASTWRPFPSTKSTAAGSS